jgi:diguanylate cyclase (GGDEF)-like protein
MLQINKAALFQTSGKRKHEATAEKKTKSNSMVQASIAAIHSDASSLQQANPQNPAPHGRILLVDDILDNRVVLKRRLLRRGFDVVEADSGEMALELHASMAFDLVLLDVMMPGISGLDVLGRIRSKHSSQELPVIMVTANSMSNDVVDALKLGADDYVTKPVDFEVALARINTQIERKKIADAASKREGERVIQLQEARAIIDREQEEKKRTESQVRYLATRDQLTQIFNRGYVLDAAKQAAEEHAAGRGSYEILFLDLDRFKSINDSFGHNIGDKILREVAQRLQQTVSPRDTLARFGGDEFVILHSNEAGTEAGTELGSRLIRRICEPYSFDGHEFMIGVSIGIAAPSERNEAPEITIGNADMAMYWAKNDGGNRTRSFDREMAEAAHRRLELEHDLRFAIKRGELNILYQPIVRLSDHRVASFEALLRWTHPTHGQISPAEFIPIAEDSGLIISIGEWVLRSACIEASGWPDEIAVAVNLSAVQFERGGLLESVALALARSGLPPHRLELEITESLVLKRSEETIAALRQLRGLGVRIAMDDFGTGYSTLGNLRDLEFDKIKVDQCFVRSLPVDEGSRAIVHSISGLAKALGISATAEGVETEEQMLIIREHGIGQVQGFFFSKPIADTEIGETIRLLNGSAAGE